MPDIADYANDLAEQQEMVAEYTIRSKAAPETHDDFDGLHCIDCGDAIHPVRLNLGRVRCVYCQVVREEMLAQGAR